MRERWFDRSGELGLDAGALPGIVGRLRSAPDRLEHVLDRLMPDQLILKPGGAWTVQENAGHLLDLEPLWYGRLNDLMAGNDALRPAELTNHKTHAAGHIDQPTLGSLSTADLKATPLHPRLRQPMSVTDLFFFVAEHDDHHLARIAELASQG